jgi:hypothetical protein
MEQGCDVVKGIRAGRTPLMEAAAKGQVSVAGLAVVYVCPLYHDPCSSDMPSTPVPASLVICLLEP